MFSQLKSTYNIIPKDQVIRTVYGFCRIGCRDVVGHGINGSANYKDDSHFPFPAIRFKENTRDICPIAGAVVGAVAAGANRYRQPDGRGGDAETSTGICARLHHGERAAFSEAPEMLRFEIDDNLPKVCNTLNTALREKERGDWRQLCCEEKKALYRASFCQTFAEFKAPTGQWKFIVGWTLIVVSFGFWTAMFFHYYVHEPLPSSFSKASQKAQLRRMLELRVNPIDGISSKWDYDNDRWK